MLFDSKHVLYFTVFAAKRSARGSTNKIPSAGHVILSPWRNQWRAWLSRQPALKSARIIKDALEEVELDVIPKKAPAATAPWCADRRAISIPR